MKNIIRLLALTAVAVSIAGCANTRKVMRDNPNIHVPASYMDVIDPRYNHYLTDAG